MKFSNFHTKLWFYLEIREIEICLENEEFVKFLKSIIPDIVGWNLRYFQNLQCNRQLRCIQSDMGLVDRSMLEAYYIGKKKIIIIRDNTRFHFFSCNQYSFSIEIGSYQFHVKKNKSYYYFFSHLLVRNWVPCDCSGKVFGTISVKKDF